MAHAVETMMSVKEVPWHGLGKIINKAPSVQEGIKLAGLDWKVELQELVTEYGISVDKKAVVRKDKDVALGVVGSGYTPVQNKDAFDWFNPFIESKECSLETAGSLWDGKRVWVLAKLNRTPIEVVKGDIINKFILLSNSHDGTQAVRIGFTPIRVVCNNTLAMAHNDNKSDLIRVMHRKNVVTTMEMVRDTVNAANARFEATAEQYKALIRKRVSKKDLEKYVKVVFTSDTKMSGERQKLALEKMTETITRLFETGRGNDLKGVRGTSWALYNAATEYLTYERGRDEDRRLHELWWGQYKQTNELALETALSL